MLTTLPIELQENIFQYLEPKDRMRFRTCCKQVSKIGDKQKDKQYFMICKYIDKYKSDFKANKKKISLKLLNYLKDNKKDIFITKTCNEINLEIEQNKHSLKISDYDILLDDIRNNKLQEKYDISNWKDNTSFHRELIYTISRHMSSETWKKLNSNQMLYDMIVYIFETYIYMFNTFIVYLILYLNEALLNTLLNEEYPLKDKLQFNLQTTIRNINEDSTLRTITDPRSIDLCLKYFDVSENKKNDMFEFQIENTNFESASVLI